MVRLALQELGGSCRHLLELRYLTDPAPSYAQIARRLDVSTGAIGPMRARCLQKLRKILERMGY
jgi:DNA-directed RNA polymerase specialized sigma24 family protein